MKRQYAVTNKSFYQDEELFPLLDLAWRVAWTGRPAPIPGRTYRVTVKKTKHNYCGHAGFACCLLRIGDPAKPVTWPLKATYPKFKDMPEYFLNSWREVVVHLAAHEFAHLTGYSGRKQGEMMCEMISWDAVDAYRKEQALTDARIDQALAAKAQRVADRKAQEAAAMRQKKSPEYKLERLAAQEKVWLRKLRLALTKMKKIKRSRALILSHQRRAGQADAVHTDALAAKPSA